MKLVLFLKIKGVYMKIINYEVFHKDVDYSQPTIFLAGPTVRGNQTHLTSWRDEAIEIFKEKEFIGNLIVPEFENKYESDEVRFDLPQWEFEGLKRCHVIMFWVPRTRELQGQTTNWEHGYWVHRGRDKMVYGRPREAYRTNYLDIMWVEDLKDRFNKNSGAHIYTTLERTVQASMDLCLIKFAVDHGKTHD